MNKVAVVTGAARGLGAEIAQFLSGCGYDVAIHYNRSEAEAKSVLSNVGKNSPNSKLFSADLKNQDDVDRFACEVLDSFGKVDLVVNNVGNFLFKKFADKTNPESGVVLECN